MIGTNLIPVLLGDGSSSVAARSPWAMEFQLRVLGFGSRVGGVRFGFRAWGSRIKTGGFQESQGALFKIMGHAGPFQG